MKKVMIEFEIDSEYDRIAVNECLNADKAYIVLKEITGKLFRPARKHGYPNKAIEDLRTEIGDKADDLIFELEKMYNELISDAGVVLDE
jgi:hypothetical protein